MDVLDRVDLPFPHSLPEFQRLFPDDAECAAYLEKARWGCVIFLMPCAPSSTTGISDAMPYAFGSPSCSTVAPMSICGFVESTVVPRSLIVTDDWSGYAGLGKRGYEHFALAYFSDLEVANAIPVTIIHLVCCQPEDVADRYPKFGVSHQHLQAYLSEFSFRFNRRSLPVERLPLIDSHRGRHLCSKLCRALLGRVAAPYM